MDTDLLILGILGAGTLISAALVVVHPNLIRSVAAYAVASAFLAGLFFVLASPFAGALELTVGAGLVAVLFLVALLLAGHEQLQVRA